MRGLAGHEAGVTFPDALGGVRHWLWAEAGFPLAGGGTSVEKLPERLPELLPTALTPAA